MSSSPRAGDDRGDAAAVEGEAAGVGLEPGAAALLDGAEDAFDVALRVADRTVAREVEAGRELRREGGLQGVDLGGVEEVVLDAGAVQHAAVVPGVGEEAFLRAGDLEPAAGADEVGEAALLDDDVVRLVGVGEEGGQRVGDGLGAGGAARQREADQPRQEAGEVAPSGSRADCRGRAGSRGRGRGCRGRRWARCCRG